MEEGRGGKWAVRPGVWAWGIRFPGSRAHQPPQFAGTRLGWSVEVKRSDPPFCESQAALRVSYQGSSQVADIRGVAHPGNLRVPCRLSIGPAEESLQVAAGCQFFALDDRGFAGNMVGNDLSGLAATHQGASGDEIGPKTTIHQDLDELGEALPTVFGQGPLSVVGPCGVIPIGRPCVTNDIHVHTLALAQLRNSETSDHSHGTLAGNPR